MVDPNIPTVHDLASDPLVHRFDEMFNPPGLTNFLGAAQVDHDLAAVRSIAFPPLAQGETVTGNLFVDGRLFRSYGLPVTFTWRPDCVIRSAVVRDLRITTTTVCVQDVPAVVVDIDVRNLSGVRRPVTLGLACTSTVTRHDGPWNEGEAPWEANPGVAPDVSRGRLSFRSPKTGAVCLQGVDVPTAQIDHRGLEVATELAPGGSWRFGFVVALGADEASAAAAYDWAAADVLGHVYASEQRWNDELAAVFHRDNGTYGGSLPVLETDSDAMRRLYWMGIAGVIWFRRDNPASVLGRSYDTLMPRYWQTVTFIWDYSLSSMVHSLLDPHVMRRHLEHWIGTDIHTHFGTEWLTGGPIGNWYSVNDYAMTRLVRDYIRWTGDVQWLGQEIATPTQPARTVLHHLAEWGVAWQGLRGQSGLADYGGINNLLECVSTYVHEVASLNAANVWCLRVAAETAALFGDDPGAAATLAAAAGLADQVSQLYFPGRGHWRARQPDGQLVPVRHCYDFATVGVTMGSDLTAAQRQEMVDFFVRELQTPTWMRALSPYDPDSAFSVRPDHQWNGAYPAWPAEAAKALVQLGRDDVVADWLPGLAASTNQGPFGQAHFTEEAIPLERGGARKAPPHPPYLIDWACSSSGAWASLVIESLFGVNVGLDGTVGATPALERIDPGARLRGLVIRGQSHDVTAAGIVPSRRLAGV
jgi:hypothetical protein